MTSMIVPKIILRMKQHLYAELRDGIPESDHSRVDRVKVGRFQENPKDYNIWLAINGGDPEDPNYLDGIVTLDDLPEIGFRAPVREIGGGEAWFRRGVVYIGCFYVKEGLLEENAMENAYAVYGRVQSAIKTMNVTDLKDDFGESALLIFSFGGSFFQAGGPKDKYYWRGKALWQVLTYRE